MWALLSTRLRTWVLFAVAVPVVRSVIRRAARHATATAPEGRASRGLTRADTMLARFDRRRRRA